MKKDALGRWHDSLGKFLKTPPPEEYESSVSLPIMLNDGAPVTDNDAQRMEADQKVRKWNCPPVGYKISTTFNSILSCPFCLQTAIDRLLSNNPGQMIGVVGVSSEKSCEVRNEEFSPAKTNHR